MDERILAPIGLGEEVIEGSTDGVWIKLAFAFKYQLLKQGGFYEKLHSPIHSRSPPMLT